MMRLTRCQLAVALAVVVGLATVEVGFRAWRGGAANARAPLPRQDIVKRSLAPGEVPAPRQPPSVGYLGQTAVDFAGTKTLNDALELVKQELILDDKADFAALLSEKRVRGAVRAATSAHEAILIKSEKEGVQVDSFKEFFIGKAKPVFMKIAEERIWPPNCNFSASYQDGASIDGKRLVYDGFWLRLQIHTEKSKQGHDNFAIPIIDMAFGEVGQ